VSSPVPQSPPWGWWQGAIQARDVRPACQAPAPVPHSRAVKTRTLAQTLAASLVLLACSRAGADLKTLTVDQVAARVAAHDGKTFVFDDNPHDVYARGHVPGAHWVASSEPTAAELPADHGAMLVFYCASEL
jgi:hypothetical protein